MPEPALLARNHSEFQLALSTFERSETCFRRLLEKLPAGAYTCDPQGLITYYNPEAVRLWGRAPTLNDPVDRFCGSFRLYSADGNPISHDRCWMALALQQQAGFNGEEIIVERPDGRRLTVLAHANPILDEQGRLLGAVNVLVDITERKRMEEALREADRQKDEFLALLGHELRNPLSVVVNGIEMLRRDGLPEDKSQRLHELVDRQARHMQRLVDDLLDLARISRGKITLRPERVDLIELASRVAEDHRPAIAAAGCTLSVTPTGPLFVQADPTRLAQMIGNLLHNACKFTDPGGRITLRVGPDNASASAVITVEDAGVGMSAATLSGLFQPFTQSETTLGRSHGGLGLGLALVKGLAELHGGSITAHSAGPGQGSEFTVRLPLADSLRSPVSETCSASARDECSFRTLLVEDSKPVAEIFAMLLREMGHEVHVAASGSEALERMPALKPEVVFSDISMPGMSGYELAQHVRARPGGLDVFLVAMTGFGQPEDRQRALDAGFDEHLVKPAELDRLQSLLAGVPRHRRD